MNDKSQPRSNLTKEIHRLSSNINIKSERQIGKEESDDFSKSFYDRKKEQELEREQKKHDLAVKTYGNLFIAIYTYIALVLLLLTGNTHYFQLEETVLVVLLSTTTVNILGVFYIASKWLYETKR